jgi:hypothetical protein
MLLCSMRASWRYCYQTHALIVLGRVPFVYLLRAQYDVWAKPFDFCFRWSLHFSDNNYPDWQRHLILPKTCDKLGWMSQWFGRPLHDIAAMWQLGSLVPNCSTRWVSISGSESGASCACAQNRNRILKPWIPRTQQGWWVLKTRCPRTRPATEALRQEW